MGEVWLQVVARNEGELATLQEAVNLKNARVALANVDFRLQERPQDSKALTEKGLLLLVQGEPGKAELTLRLAIAANENEADAHYYLGLIYRMTGRLAESAEEFGTVIRLKPEHYKAHANLGFVHLERGRLTQAESELHIALRLNPYDSVTQQGLEMVRKAKPRGSP
jgi:Flp pilus assembly protein TadD